MNCVETQENLDALIDGELAGALQANAEAHLKECPACRAEYEKRQAVGAYLRQNWQISASAELDKQVFGAFRQFQRQKQLVEPSAPAQETRTEKNAWFGTPWLSWGTAFAVLVLTAFAAFQIGKTSAARDYAASEKSFDRAPLAENGAPENSKSIETPQIQTISVPVIQEKIVKIPVVREKIVTRYVYINNKTGGDGAADPRSNLRAPESSPLAVKSQLEDNQYSTQVNLTGFQFVSDLKPQIIKSENNEK